MVTLYDADLEIVGLTTQDALASNVDSKMGEIIKYYAANKIKALVRFVEENRLIPLPAAPVPVPFLQVHIGPDHIDVFKPNNGHHC